MFSCDLSTQQKDETLPFREEEEEVKTELSRLMENLQAEATAESDQQRRVLFQTAADVVSSYVRERWATPL